MSAGFPAFRRHVSNTRAADANGIANAELARRRENTKQRTAANVLEREVQAVRAGIESNCMRVWRAVIAGRTERRSVCPEGR